TPNCTIRRAGLGRQPAASAPHAVITQRRCCPTAKCSSQEDLTEIWTPALISRARNSTIRRAGLGRPLAASSPRAVLTRQRCCLTAECSSQQEWAQEECRSSFLPLRNCTTRRSSTRRSLSSTSPPGPAYRRRIRCSSAASLSPGRKTKPCSSAELDPPLRLLGSRCLWLIQHSNCMTTPPP